VVADVPPSTRATSLPTFHALRVQTVINETPDAISIVFDVPSDLREEFSYRAGQFVTLRLEIDGREEMRAYSMSSAPGIDAGFQVTVKRVTDGLVSNWIVSHTRDGDRIEVSTPAGVFVLPEGDLENDVIAFAAGSGITPIFSIVKAVLTQTDRSVRMIYANRDEASVIFGRDLEALEAQYPERLQIRYSLDVEDGFVEPKLVTDLLGASLRSEFYVCGPKAFMDMVTTTLVWCGARSDQLHVELFTPEDEEGRPSPGVDAEVTVTVGGKTATITHRAGWTLVHAARAAGLPAPSSCHLGQCGTCAARVTKGRAEMVNNQVLTADEVADGWILTCQARPVTPELSVVYE
jgi:ferredoxin-NADP reductase